ncbi:conserved hypothetical protein [Streptomyces sp. SPB78]|nr:conserved hypothetical protein [Streptomyces sp. SPB78]
MGAAVRAGHRASGNAPALAPGPRPARADRAGDRRPAARGRPAPARRARPPRRRAPAAGDRRQKKKKEEREADAAAAGQAYTALQTLEDQLKEWGSPRQSWSRTKDLGPAVLRAGGLSQRDLKRTAGYLETSEDIAAFWLELAYAAGLVAADGEADEHYAPTPYFDGWLDLPPARRWAVLASAWLGATRTSGLVGGSDSKDRTLSALGPHLDRTAAPEVRHRVLALLAELSPGSVPEPDSLLARLRWERPLRGAAHENDLRTRIAGWTLDEAELLGVTGRGALTRQGRALLAGQDTALNDMLAELLPPPLYHVLLQADLTAVAPGPLQRPLAERLALLADVESKGGATVYRFTPGSVRRSLDAGYSAEAIHEFLTTHSLTPVPQPLAYLVDDVARRHGHLRVGAASSYVRCEEATVLDEILADRRSETLRLRRLAPTVAASPSEPAVLLDGLRGLGFAPAAEGPGGDVLVRSGAQHRTPPRRAPEPVGEGGARPRQTMLAAAVRAIRAGDTAVTTPPPAPPAGLVTPSEPPRSSASETLVTLQNAVLTGESVWIGLHRRGRRRRPPSHRPGPCRGRLRHRLRPHRRGTAPTRCTASPASPNSPPRRRANRHRPPGRAGAADGGRRHPHRHRPDRGAEPVPTGERRPRGSPSPRGSFVARGPLRPRGRRVPSSASAPPRRRGGWGGPGPSPHPSGRA